MDVFRTAWTDVVIGTVALKDVFHSEVISQVISKRSAEHLASRSVAGVLGSAGFVAAVVIECVVALAIFLFISYTLNSVFPLLAIVEDDATTLDYEPVQLKDDSELEKTAEYMASPGNEEGPVTRSRPVTSNLRSTYRLLRATRGFRGLWRGFDYALVHSIFAGLIMAAFRALPSVFSLVGFAVASLLTVQLGVAWTHSVISEPSQRTSFWQRLPPFKLAFRATALPTLTVWLASGLTQQVPVIIDGLTKDSKYDAFGWLLALGLWVFLHVFIVTPATVVLVRVQASLLPEGDQAIVAFDRGLTLHRASGKEYMTMQDAWNSFSRAAWIRLVKLCAKVWAVSVPIVLAMVLIAASEFYFVHWLSERR